MASNSGKTGPVTNTALGFLEGIKDEAKELVAQGKMSAQDAARLVEKLDEKADSIKSSIDDSKRNVSRLLGNISNSKLFGGQFLNDLTTGISTIANSAGVLGKLTSTLGVVVNLLLGAVQEQTDRWSDYYQSLNELGRKWGPQSQEFLSEKYLAKFEMISKFGTSEFSAAVEKFVRATYQWRDYASYISEVYSTSTSLNSSGYRLGQIDQISNLLTGPDMNTPGWAKRLGISANNQSLQEITRFFNDSYSILDNIYGKAEKMSSSLMVAPGQLVNVIDTYTRSIRLLTNNNESFTKSMNELIDVASVLEDRGISSSAVIGSIDTWLYQGMGNAMANSLTTTMSMMGINPVQSWINPDLAGSTTELMTNLYNSPYLQMLRSGSAAGRAIGMTLLDSTGLSQSLGLSNKDIVNWAQSGISDLEEWKKSVDYEGTRASKDIQLGFEHALKSTLSESQYFEPIAVANAKALVNTIKSGEFKDLYLSVQKVEADYIELKQDIARNGGGQIVEQGANLVNNAVSTGAGAAKEFLNNLRVPSEGNTIDGYIP